MADETTLLATDIVASTRLWERHPRQMAQWVERHDGIIHGAAGAYDGRLLRSEGDSHLVRFASAPSAVAAAATAMAELGRRCPFLAVRMGLDATGAVDTDDPYGDWTRRAVAICDAGAGATILLSATAAASVAAAVPGDWELADRGCHRLRGLNAPERVHQLARSTDRREATPIRSLAAVPTNLPTPRSSDLWPAEYSAVRRLLLREHVRLVTLVADDPVAAVRATRAAAWGLLADFPGGAWRVAHNPGVPASIDNAAARTLAAAPLSVGPKLLVLECVPAEQACEVASVLAAHADIACLAAGSAPLWITGEHVVRCAITPRSELALADVRLLDDRSERVKGLA